MRPIYFTGDMATTHLFTPHDAATGETISGVVRAEIEVSVGYRTTAVLSYMDGSGEICEVVPARERPSEEPSPLPCDDCGGSGIIQLLNSTVNCGCKQ